MREMIKLLINGVTCIISIPTICILKQTKMYKKIGSKMTATCQQQQPPFYGHYTGQPAPALASTSS